ncbi:hypothetical protein E2C01_097356 [Portunus trituberculatus]|uniref:Uncharacterized protein n=1 Tax=Portunus trituberculatus TaxID=210409 RepID=A0A5B7K496_PORTR|nr:hypothetical protein [Portunus trituberculatus]
MVTWSLGDTRSLKNARAAPFSERYQSFLSTNIWRIAKDSSTTSWCWHASEMKRSSKGLFSYGAGSRRESYYLHHETPLANKSVQPVNMV